MSRRQFSPEFKQEAVKLVLEHDRSATAVAVAVAVAPELVIAQRSVSAWVQKAHAAPSASVSLRGPERRELCALRRWRCCWICTRARWWDSRWDLRWIGVWCCRRCAAHCKGGESQRDLCTTRTEAANTPATSISKSCGRTASSMSRAGNCYANAPSESFFSTLKNDDYLALLHLPREHCPPLQSELVLHPPHLPCEQRPSLQSESTLHELQRPFRQRPSLQSKSLTHPPHWPFEQSPYPAQSEFKLHEPQRPFEQEP